MRNLAEKQINLTFIKFDSEKYQKLGKLKGNYVSNQKERKNFTQMDKSPNNIIFNFFKGLDSSKASRDSKDESYGTEYMNNRLQIMKNKNKKNNFSKENLLLEKQESLTNQNRRHRDSWDDRNYEFHPIPEIDSLEVRDSEGRDLGR